jgi:hypothetical protein
LPRNARSRPTYAGRVETAPRAAGRGAKEDDKKSPFADTVRLSPFADIHEMSPFADIGHLSSLADLVYDVGEH